MTGGASDANPEARGSESSYALSVLVSGYRVHCKSRVRRWEDWPADAVDTLRRWNKSGRLSFRYMRNMWGGYATGFESLTFKCVDCGGFFNASGSTACQFDGRLYCDDCIIEFARSSPDVADAKEGTCSKDS